jgi:hypothetical protein
MSALMQTRYVEEYIEDFGRRKATLVNTVRTDVQDRGGSMIFLVAGSGGREAVTRGVNGLIPTADDSQVQVTLNFNEDHDHVVKTSFNIFTAHGDQLGIMRKESIGVIHRKQDSRILTAIATGTVTLGTIPTMSKDVANKIAVTLANADVGTEDDGMLFAAVSPAAWAELTDITSFASADYVHFGAESPVEAGMQVPGRFKQWMGINWTTHNALPGARTSTATCLAWHKNAVGYATSTRGIDAQLGYDNEQDYTWRRATIFHGAVKLLNAGIVKWVHDDTAALA